MNNIRYSKSLLSLMTLAGLAACGSDAPTTTEQDVMKPPAMVSVPDESGQSKDVKPFGPVRIGFRIIGTPVVGRPVLIDLDIRSAYGAAPVELSYRIPDTTALEFSADQMERVSLAAPQDDAAMAHQVSVVPQREGRLYLNVSAEVATQDGPQSTVTAIPIQVGAAPRELEENGTVIEDESGELIRTMPAADK